MWRVQSNPRMQYNTQTIVKNWAVPLFVKDASDLWDLIGKKLSLFSTRGTGSSVHRNGLVLAKSDYWCQIKEKAGLD